MVGSIERLCRWIVRRPMLPMMPMMIVVIGVNTPDPTRRDMGYGGVLPVPGPSTVTATAAAHVDPMLDARQREARIQRGRVLYASGRGPAASTPTAPRVARKGPCPQQRVVQGRGTTASPNT